MTLKKLLFYFMLLNSFAVHSQEWSGDSVLFSCPQWIETGVTTLPVSLVFFKDGKIDPLINHEFSLGISGASINPTSFQIRNGVGTLTIQAESSASFDLKIPELGLSRHVEIKSYLPRRELHGTLTHSIVVNPDTVYVITENLVVPEGISLEALPGSLILLNESCNITVSGELRLQGSSAQPIIIKSHDSARFWGGIECLYASDTVEMNGCMMIQGGHDQNKIFGHSQSQPVIFADHSNLRLSDCYLFDNPGKAFGSIESFIGIANSILSRCDTGGEFQTSVISVSNSGITEMPDADGVVDDDDNDGFYFNGVHSSGAYSMVQNCVFAIGEDDAIDHNGARLKIENCRIDGFYHEGVACSNSNWVQVFNTLIMNCDQGVEAGYGSPNVVVDHCVILNCASGFRFGDSYDWGCTGKLNITNSIAYGNSDNIRNWDNLIGGPVDQAIDVAFTMTNDSEYDSYSGCFSGIPVFDDLFYLKPGSPGTGRGNDQTNVGLYQEKSVVTGIREYYITCDPADFERINQNYQEDIYVPITIAFDGTTIDQARIRIRGDGTRVHPKKSLKVKLDNGSFSDGRTVLNFNAEYEDKSYLQQYIVSRLMRESGLPCFDAEHVRLYLNGEYLGLYLLIENMDENFLSRRGLDPSANMYKATMDGASLSIYDNIYFHWEKKTGSGGRQDLQDLINEMNRVRQDQYPTFAQNTLSYDNMINILALNLLTRNYSTYYHNYYMYHDLNRSGKWFMFPWDLDKTILYYSDDMIYHHSSKFWAPDNPFIERAILSEGILSDIRERIQQLHETRLNDAYLAPIIDSLHQVLANSVRDDQGDNIGSLAEWESYVNRTYTAFDTRFVKLENQFENLSPSFQLSRMNRMFEPYEGVRFNWTATSAPNAENVTFKLFFGKEMDLDNGSSTIIPNLTDTSYFLTEGLPEGKYYWKVVAVQGSYQIEGYDNYNVFWVGSAPARIVINEINYNSSPDFDPGDWVELYNNSDQAVDMSNWVFMDKNNLHNFNFSSGTIINPHQYIVLCTEKSKFLNLFPNTGNIQGDLGFGLSGSGELIRLYDNLGIMVDSLVFDNKLPWPPKADGTGSTLELTNPELDNALASSWVASDSHGSPGMVNPSFDSIQNPDNYQIQLMQNYPNPFRTSTVISYTLSKPASTRIEIYNVMGRLVVQQPEELLSAGTNYFTVDGGRLSSGIYYYTIFLNGVRQSTRSMIKIGEEK